MSKFLSVTLADLAMVGFAISFLTLARVESPICFSWILCDMPQDDIEMESMVSHFAQSENVPSRATDAFVPHAHHERPARTTIHLVRASSMASVRPRLFSREHPRDAVTPSVCGVNRFVRRVLVG